MNAPLVLSDGKRPVRKIAAAAALFTLALLWIYANLSGLTRGPANGLWALLQSDISQPMIWIGTGIYLMRIKTVTVDGDGGKLTIRRQYGPFSNTVTKNVEWDYVSVFYDANVYSVRLWYVKNRHFVLAEFDEKSAAMALASQITERFNLDLLDATLRGQNRWVNQ